MRRAAAMFVFSLAGLMLGSGIARAQDRAPDGGTWAEWQRKQQERWRDQNQRQEQNQDRSTSPPAPADAGERGLRAIGDSGWSDQSRDATVTITVRGSHVTLAFPALALDGTDKPKGYFDVFAPLAAGTLDGRDTELRLRVRASAPGAWRVRLNVLPGSRAGAPGSRHDEFCAFEARIEAVAEWRELTVALADFKLMWAMSGQPAFAPERVTGVGIEPVETGAPATIELEAMHLFAGGSPSRPGAPPPVTPAENPSGHGHATPANSLDRIVFNSDRSGNLEIWIMDGDGKNPAPLTAHPGFDLWPAFSPDGRRVVWMTNRDGDGSKFELFVMSSDGSEVKNLSQRPDSSEGHPCISPDGNTIAFSSDASGDMDLYLMNADGSDWRRLCAAPGPDGLAVFAPDSRSLVFVSERDGNHELYRVNADGSGLKRMTDNTALDTMPAISPDGRLIAFCSDRDGVQGIYVMGVDGSGVRRLSLPGTFEAWPHFSADGSRIVCQRMVDGQFDLFSRRIDGSEEVRLTRNRHEDRNPRWGLGVEPAPAVPAPAGGVALAATIAGSLTSGPGPNPQKYPFELSGRTTLTPDELAPLARDGDVPAAIVAKLALAFAQPGGDRADEVVSAAMTVRGGQLTGTVVVRHREGSGRGTRTLTVDLAGAFDPQSKRLTLAATRVAVAGTWDWGGGTAELSGEATVTLRITASDAPRRPAGH